MSLFVSGSGNAVEKKHVRDLSIPDTRDSEFAEWLSLLYVLLLGFSLFFLYGALHVAEMLTSINMNTVY